MRRFFKILKWCMLGVLGIVGIFLVVNGIRIYLAGARLDAKIEALRAAGEPTSLADLARQPIPPERNAETYLRRAEKDVLAINSEVDAADLASSKADQEAFDDGRPTPALRQSMRAALAAYPQAMPLIEQASNCPDYDPQLDFHTDAQSFSESMCEQIQYFRTVFRTANYRVLIQLDDGHPEDALQTCLAMLRLARLYDHNPMLISQLVAVAVLRMAVGDTNLVLRSGSLPLAAYTAIEQELALLDMPERFRQTLRSERGFGLQSFHDLAVGVMAPTVRLMPWFKNDMCDYLDVMAECIQSASLPNSEWNSVNGPLRSRQLGPLVGSIPPALQQSHDAMVRIQAQLRSLRVLNALLQREQTGGTGEPTLAELGLPPEVTTDPFNDKPLQLKKLQAGWLVYSVGTNLEDDGGDLTDNLDVGVGPPPDAKAGGDQETPP